MTVNGEPLANRLTDIGYLPQDEVVHGRLTVVEALELRGAAAAAGRHERRGVRRHRRRARCEELELGEHADTRIELAVRRAAQARRVSRPSC